jgi:hypothetical protein
MSDYKKYITYKMKYLNLRNTSNANQIGGGEKQLIYKTKIKNTPTEYLQNILFIIITKENLSLKNIYIDYIPDPVEQNKSTPDTINIVIYNLKAPLNNTQIDTLKQNLDEKLSDLIV